MNTVSTGGQHAHTVKKEHHVEELISNSDSERNWAGVFIALLVISLVLGLILLSTLLLSPKDLNSANAKSKIPPGVIQWRAEELLTEHNATWTSRNELVYRNALGGISLYSPQTDSIREFMDNSTFRQLNAQKFLLSSDYKYVVFITEIEDKETNWKGKRFFGYYHIYEVATKVRFPVSPSVTTKEYDPPPKLQYLLFSPSPHSSGYAFVHNFDIYYVPSGEVRAPVQITSRGNWIYNGYPDWIYQNEIIAEDSHCIWFSPDSTHLSYLSFDDSSVGKVTVLKYPGLETLPYPKPGTPIPIVKVTVVRLNDTTRMQTIEKPSKLAEAYFAGFHWSSSSEFVLAWTNRPQNLTLFYICSLSPTVNCSYENSIKTDKIWARMSYPTDLKLIEGLVGSGRLFSRLFHRAKNWIYYEEDFDNGRYLYGRTYDTNTTLETVCLSCSVSVNTSGAHRCFYSRSTFSPDLQFYVIECLGPDFPFVSVYRTSDATEPLRQFTVSYPLLQSKTSGLLLPATKIFGVELDDGLMAKVKLRIPPSLQVEDDDFLYPVILEISDRPHFPSVTHRWTLNYFDYLVSNFEYIVVTIDPPAGKSFVGAALTRLAVLQYLRDTLKFLDFDRSGVIGIGDFGGYLGALMLSLDLEDLIKCGALISGVYSWPQYNSVFTERYLRTANLSDNYRGYEESDVIKKSGNLFNKTVFIVDSITDTNVHYVHSMLLIKSLISQGILYTHLTYPEDLDSSRLHLYQNLDNFWAKRFEDET